MISTRRTDEGVVLLKSLTPHCCPSRMADIGVVFDTQQQTKRGLVIELYSNINY